MDNEIPKILISATIYDSDDEDNIPSIIVTRDSREEDFSSSSPRTPPSLYPASMYTAAADTEAARAADDFTAVANKEMEHEERTWADALTNVFEEEEPEDQQ